MSGERMGFGMPVGIWPPQISGWYFNVLAEICNVMVSIPTLVVMVFVCSSFYCGFLNDQEFSCYYGKNWPW